MRWVKDAGVIDGAHLGTARRFKPAHALGALARLDYVYGITLTDRLVLALRLASATAYALLSDLVSQLLTSSKWILSIENAFTPSLSPPFASETYLLV
jgi:hypothetical protein